MRFAFIVISLLGCVAVARADDAEQLLHDGVALRKQGQEAAALEQFRRSYELAPSAHALAQIALVEQALGRWLDAERDLGLALAPADDEWIARNRVLLEHAQAVIARHVGQLDLVGPAGAELLIAGARVATLPLAEPLRVIAGPLDIEVRLAGYFSVFRRVEVAAQGLTREIVALAPAPTGAAPQLSATANSVALSPAHMQAPQVSAARRPLAKRWWVWTLAGAGAAAIAAGVAVAVTQSQRVEPALNTVRFP
jgi:hypothetical protein